MIKLDDFVKLNQQFAMIVNTVSNLNTMVICFTIHIHILKDDYKIIFFFHLVYNESQNYVNGKYVFQKIFFNNSNTICRVMVQNVIINGLDMGTINWS